LDLRFILQPSIFLYGVNRFDEFQKWLGIGRNILTQRLNFLVSEGLIEKRLYQSSPKRYQYVLSDQGYDACKVLLALMEYGEKWRFKKDKEPIHLFDRETGEQLYPTIVDKNTGVALDPRNLQIAPGPGFPRNKAIREERFRNHTPSLL